MASWFVIYKYIIVVTEIIVKNAKKIFWLALLSFLKAGPKNAIYLLENTKLALPSYQVKKNSVSAVILLKHFRVC